MLDPDTQRHYSRLAAWVAERTRSRPCPVFGINGAQGSGKSSLAIFLRHTLQTSQGLRAAVLSLDDCYHRRQTRRRLAHRVHPLFATRGVPGTHDTRLGIRLLSELRRLREGESLTLPRFSKADDDRLPESEGLPVYGPVDLVLFEGWCVGTPAQDECELLTPLNALEAGADSDGRWRRHVNDQLRTAYARWFAQLDWLIFLQVPGFDCVRHWRWQQERETAALHGKAGGQGLMSQDQLEVFIQHYERLTRHALRVLPECADALLTLDRDHAVFSSRLT